MITATPFLAAAAEAGVRECTAGPSRWTLETSEFALGWTGTWQIHETIRKVYVIF